MRRILSLFIVMVLGLVNAYSMSLQGGSVLKIQSPAFKEGESIPLKYTCQGEDISPPLAWAGEPSNTKSFVLIMDDPDAPGGVWDHWLMFNIPNSIHSLSENLSTLPQGSQFGKNSWGKIAYSGPCPPAGEHRYIFKLYALDTLLNLEAGANKASIESAMKEHVVMQGQLIGKYKKR